MIKQRHVAALLAEFVGTLTLVLVVLSVSLYRFPFFTAIAAGVTVAVFVSAFSKVSGGHINPAVTVGMFAMRQVSALRAVGYIVVQLLAGFVGWQLYEYFTQRTLTNATTASIEWNVVAAEFAGALIWGIALAAVVSQKIQGYQAAYTVGAGLFLGLTVAGLASNALLNPALAIGVKSWDPVTYVAGPVLGLLIGVVLVSYVIVPMFGLKKKADASVKPAAATASAAKTAKPAAKKAPAKKAAAKKTTKK
jgi:glycerol uptake facilitator-like aquaporin